MRLLVFFACLRFPEFLDGIGLVVKPVVFILRQDVTVFNVPVRFVLFLGCGSFLRVQGNLRAKIYKSCFIRIIIVIVNFVLGNAKSPVVQRHRRRSSSCKFLPPRHPLRHWLPLLRDRAVDRAIRRPSHASPIAAIS